MTNDLNENESQKLNRFIGEGNYWNALNFLKNIDHEKKILMIDWYFGHVYFKLHQYNQAAKHVEKFISKKKKDPLNLNFLAQIYSELGYYDKAMKIFNESLLIDPSNRNTILNLAKLNLNVGNIKKSENYFNSLLKKEPNNLSYYYSLSRIDKKYLSNSLIQKINSLSINDTNNNIYSHLLLAKKKELDGDFESEVKNLLKAHELYLSQRQKAYHQQFNYYTKQLPQFINDLKNRKLNFSENLKPIFIMGLPRSGTTLIEKTIVSNENKIKSLGEADVFDKVFFSNQIINNDKSPAHEELESLIEKIVKQYNEQGLNSDDKIFTDKSISNFLYIDLLVKLFPKAKFIYCRRDPLANIIGILRSFLPNIYWSHSINDIFFMTDLYLNKLEDFKKRNTENFYLLNLEEFTKNPKDTSKDLFNFLNLSWSDKHLDSMNTDFVIKTASNLQVREKIKIHNLEYTKIYLKIFKNLNLKSQWLV